MKLFSLNQNELIFFGVKFKNNKSNNLPKLPRLEVHIVDHCNLNCRGCTHFCSLADEKFLDIDVYEKDLKEIVKKINFNEIKLLGGEPLLHPQIHKFILKTREICPNIKILLTTNCILLKSATDEFWSAMKKADAMFQLTKYPPMNAQFCEILDLVDSKGIVIDGVHVANKFWLTKNPNGDSCAVKVYKNCPSAYCRQYRNSRLYICPDACYMDLYNKHFNKNIPTDEGIDIYSHTSKEIYEYLTTPKLTCRYCVSKDDYKYVDWSQSKREADEWDAVKEIKGK